MATYNMLLSSNDLDQIGQAIRADGYYGYAGGMHTVGFYLKNFKGRLLVDATLSDNPRESDWFPIGLGSGTIWHNVIGPESKIESFNIVGNFVYLRAKIQRSHLGQPAVELGVCERVTLSL